MHNTRSSDRVLTNTTERNQKTSAVETNILLYHFVFAFTHCLDLLAADKRKESLN